MSKFDKANSIRLILGVFILILSVFIFTKNLSSEPINRLTTISSTIHKSVSDTTIFLAGDIMLSRNVARKIYSANDPDLPFRNMQDEISSADISFANLESPFNSTGNHATENSLVFNADPNFVSGLVAAGFDILSTANNHAFDQGLKGLDFTVNLLRTNNIIPTGTLSSTGDPILPVIEKNNIKYGFLSYSYTAHNDGGKSSSPYINNFNDLEKLKQDILALKEHNANVVIVNMHAGIEYTRTPNDKQIAFARAAIDAGADMVVGEHPHWPQTVEQYKGKWIFYSLGNLVFDQMWSRETREGLTLLITYQKEKIIKIELKPVIIDNFCCARWANEQESLTILKQIGLTSSILLDNN